MAIGPADGFIDALHEFLPTAAGLGIGRRTYGRPPADDISTP